MIDKNLRDMVVTTDSGKDVMDTSQLSGEASDSLSGTNMTKQYETGNPPPAGPMGGLASGA